MCKASTLVTAFIACSATWGCGGESPDEDLATQSGALLGHANDVSRAASFSRGESETASDSKAGTTVISYNKWPTLPFATDTTICRGARYQGIAYSTTGYTSWTNSDLPRPAGAAYLQGDPAVVGVDAGSELRFYVTGLAVSDTMWNSLGPDQNGCVLKALLADVDRMCVWRVTFLKGSTTPTITALGCVGPVAASDRIDGTVASVANANSNVYVTYQNTRSNRPEVFSIAPGGSLIRRLVNQPSLPTYRPPIFIKNRAETTTSTALIAPDAAKQFEISFYDGTTWSAPSVIATGWSDSYVNIKNGSSVTAKIRHFRGFAAVETNGAPAPPVTYFFFSKATSSGGVRLQGVVCSVVPSWHCTEPPTLTTPQTANSFMPSVLVGHKTTGGMFPDLSLWLSFWSDSGRNDGRVDLQQGLLSTGNTLTLSETDPFYTQVPCPHVNYWGDYDIASMFNDYTPSPRILRPFTDSSDSTCNPSLDAPQQHVSVISHFF